MKDERQVLEERIAIAQGAIDADVKRIGWSLKRVANIINSQDGRADKAVQIAREGGFLRDKITEHEKHVAQLEMLQEMVTELYGPQHAAEAEEVEQ